MFCSNQNVDRLRFLQVWLRLTSWMLSEESRWFWTHSCLDFKESFIFKKLLVFACPTGLRVFLTSAVLVFSLWGMCGIKAFCGQWMSTTAGKSAYQEERAGEVSLLCFWRLICAPLILSTARAAFHFLSERLITTADWQCVRMGKTNVCLDTAVFYPVFSPKAWNGYSDLT